MKINPTAQNISLILQALDESVIPELKNTKAKDAANNIRAALNDLLQRQGPGKDLLQRIIGAGQALKKDLESHLKAGYHPAHSTSTAAAEINSGVHPPEFEQLAHHYNQLTDSVNAICLQLCQQTPRKPETAEILRRAAEWELEYYQFLPTLQSRPFGDGPEGPPKAEHPPLSPEFLKSFFSERYGPVEIQSFSLIPGGYGGKQTYFTTVKYKDSQTEDLVIRKADPVPAVSHAMYLLEQEYSFLRDLSKTSFPSPRPIDLALNIPGVDGTFYTMKRLPGEVPGTFLGRSDKVSESMLLQLAELIAELHRLPAETFSNYLQDYDVPTALNETVSERYRRQLRGWREYIRRVEHLPSPFATWILDWLENNVPEDSRRPVPIHGDFFVHNVLANSDGRITAVLDWECADLAAPEQDLAYAQPHVTKYMPWSKFMEHYKASGGQEIDERKFAFCSAYAVMRIFLGGNRSSMNIQRGINRELRYIMMELGFAGMLMQMGLGCTAPTGVQERDSGETAEELKEAENTSGAAGTLLEIEV